MTYAIIIKQVAWIAQSAEHAAVNRGVVGSSPTSGAILRWLVGEAAEHSALSRRHSRVRISYESPFYKSSSEMNFFCL